MATLTKFDVLVVGSLNVDLVVRGPRLPRPGETVQGDSFAQGFGGKGANQAMAATRLGGHVAMIGKVGRDARGDAARANLAAAGVDISRIGLAESAPTGVAVIHVDQAGEKQIFVALGANHDLRASDVVGVTARVIVTQLEITDEAVLAAAALAEKTGAKFILDPAPARPLSDALLASCHLVKPNAHEAEILTGVVVNDGESAVRAARRLVDRGANAVSIASPEGIHLVWAGREIYLPMHDLGPVDATGAGDTYMAAMAIALAEGRDVAHAASFANAAAAIKTTRHGAQSVPSRTEVEDLVGPLSREPSDPGPI